jgi:predicted RecB family endonuclease
VKKKTARIHRMKYWEIIADNLSKAGWSWACVSAVDSNGRTIWIADAHRDDGKRFVVEIKAGQTVAHHVKSSSITSSDVLTYLRHG